MCVVVVAGRRCTKIIISIVLYVKYLVDGGGGGGQWTMLVMDGWIGGLYIHVPSRPVSKLCIIGAAAGLRMITGGQQRGIKRGSGWVVCSRIDDGTNSNQRGQILSLKYFYYLSRKIQYSAGSWFSRSRLEWH